MLPKDQPSRGPCAKRQVRCVIYSARGGSMWVGTNDCANPQTVCPRAPGEGYEKCGSICQQGGHAEIMALEKAKGRSLKGAAAHITGHYWICEPCGRALRDAGIVRIHIEQ